MAQTWHDKTFGESGAILWIASLGLIALVAIYVWLISMSSQFRTATEWIMSNIPALVIVWGCFYLLQTINVLQEITLDGGQLSGKCYFGRRLNCIASDIKSLSYYPMTWKIRYINLFDPKEPGINIELQNGEIFRINPRTEEFSSLVDALKALPGTPNQIVDLQSYTSM